jgi:hypothetical protein
MWTAGGALFLAGVLIVAGCNAFARADEDDHAFMRFIDRLYLAAVRLHSSPSNDPVFKSHPVRTQNKQGAAT